MKPFLGKIRRAVGRPLVIFPVLTIGLILGWQIYLTYSRGLDIPKQNLLANGSFEDVDQHKLPRGWTVAAQGGAPHVTVDSVKGYVDKRGLRVSVAEYQKGTVRIASPTVSVEAGTSYLFKAYYLTDTEFNLLVQYQYRDGSTQLELLRHYPDYDYPWSTMSGAVTADDTVASISFVMQLVGNGYIELDSAYVVKTDVGTTVASCDAGQNLILNPSMTMLSGSTPQYWTPFSYGDNDARNTLQTQGQNIYVRSEISRFASGEAKWSSHPVGVIQHTRYCLSFLYRSDVRIDAGVDFTMPGGGTKYQFIGYLSPTTEWTRYTTYIEAPAGATALAVGNNLVSAGYVETDAYQLTRMPGDSTVFNRPLVSVTFDDGWLTSLTNGKPVLDEFGMKGVFYINPGYVGDKNFVTFAQLLELQRHGHQLGSHGDLHIDLTAFTPDKIDKDLTQAKRYLTGKLHVQTVDFASPYGKHDARSDVIIKDLYASHRGTELGVNTKQNFNPYNLRVLFVRRDTTMAELVHYIDMAKATNGWLILVYHQIEDTDNLFIVSQTTLRQHLREVQKNGLPVLTVRDALQELQAQR